jgi:hypothetical protein
LNNEELASVSRAFEAATGQAAVFSSPIVLKDGARSQVLRCPVLTTGSELSSVIIKRIKGNKALGFSEWASLAFLTELEGARGIAPRFLGGDAARQIYLMEDWGEGQNLGDLLGKAESTPFLCALSQQMGRLAAASMEREDEFEAIRRKLPGTDEVGRGREADNWLEKIDRVSQWFTALDCSPPGTFGRSVEFVCELFREPGELTAFTQGDPAPSNNHFLDGKARLLDFEYGGFRHALYDMTAWEILCPLPMTQVREMRECFREELARNCAAARERKRFEREWAAICAYRALAILTWISPQILANNQPWAENWTMREAVFVAVSRLEQVTKAVAELQGISQGAMLLLRKLREVWAGYESAEELLPRWR